MAERDKQSYMEMTGMVIETRPIGEYDRRVVLLTRESGKISAFARGARRPSSALLAATDLFCFGHFRLYAGRDSYTLLEAQVDRYFEYFRTHFEDAMLAQYCMEVLGYCTRENNDETVPLILAYQTLRALEAQRIPSDLIRSVFELRVVVAQGEFAMPADTAQFLPATVQALRHICSAPLSGLYTFTLNEASSEELSKLACLYLERCFHHRFRSAEVLNYLRNESR